jgi:hypothetical protein
VNGLDVDLPTSLEMFLITWCRVLDVVAVACLPQPLVAVALLPLLIAFHFLKELYRYTHTSFVGPNAIDLP